MLTCSVRRQERFEESLEAVYVERSAVDAGAQPGAGHNGLDDGIADFKGSATKALRYTPFGNGMRNCVGAPSCSAALALKVASSVASCNRIVA